MSIGFLSNFKMVPYFEADKDIVQQAAEAITCISEMAECCSNVAATIQDGDKPCDEMVLQLIYISATLSSLTGRISGLIESEAMK